VLSRLKTLAGEEPEKYAEFWRRHARLFKLGYSDYANREVFAELLRFNSSIHEDAKGLTSLAEYAGRMKEGQKAIYALSGPSREAVRLSARLEIFRRKGVEVLFLYEPIDEFILDTLREFSGHKLVSAEQRTSKSFRPCPTWRRVPRRGLTDAQKTALDGLVAAFKSTLASGWRTCGPRGGSRTVRSAW
jgi:molecular chaperone HtpG